MSLRMLQPSSFVFYPKSFAIIYLKTSYLKMGKLCLPTVMGFGILFAMEKRVKAIANPFRYGQAVSGAQYYDRDAVGESLYRAIAGGASNVVLYAPRRYGKTSLVKKIISRWSEDGFTCLYFDMMKIDSAERFCEKVPDDQAQRERQKRCGNHEQKDLPWQTEQQGAYEQHKRYR